MAEENKKTSCLTWLMIAAAIFATTQSLDWLLNNDYQKPITSKTEKAAPSGPIDPAGLPGIPDGLNFSDSLERIIEVMGREPEANTSHANDLESYQYTLTPLPGIDSAKLYFIFDDGSLYCITLNFFAYQAKFKAIADWRYNLALHFENEYGPPKYVTQDEPDNQGNIYDLTVWELSHNTVSISPIFPVEEEEMGFFAIIFPRDPKGRYQTTNS